MKLVINYLKFFSELVGNAYEHGGSDCLIDVDVTNNNYYKECEPDNQCYYGLNAVILNFSNTLFHESLKMKLQNVNDLPERYLKVNTAKQYHLKHLNDNYFENDFYTLLESNNIFLNCYNNVAVLFISQNNKKNRGEVNAE